VPAVLLAVVVVIAVALWALTSVGSEDQGDVDLFTVAPRSFPVVLREKGELKAAKSVDVKSQVEGRSTIIWLIEEGSQVKEGDLLVRLASDEIEERVRSEEIKEANAAAAAAAAEKEHEILLDQNASDFRKAKLALEMAELELQKYVEGDWEQTKLDLQLELDRAEKVLARAKVELEASEALYADEFITRGDLFRDELAALEADAAIKKARLNKQTTEKYTYEKEYEQRKADVEEARKELERVEKSNTAKADKSAASLAAKEAEWALTKERLDKYREQQANCEIRAPQDGMVVYNSESHRWRSDRQITEGAEVHERQTIINLPDTSLMQVKVRIHEAKTDKIALGQLVTVEVEGQSGQAFTGKVTKIAALADSQNMWLNPDLKEYETEITLDPTDAPLKPGVTARADIIVTERDNVLAVPVQTVFTKAGHHFVFRQNGGDAEPVEVEVGVSSDELVEVVTGLEEGDQVLLAVSDVLRQTLPELEPKVNHRAETPKPEASRKPGGERRRPGAGQSGRTRGKGRPPRRSN
jgi:HlyD family secretion protein